MDAAAFWSGLVGAGVGAFASLLGVWFTQRGQARRDEAAFANQAGRDAAEHERQRQRQRDEHQRRLQDEKRQRLREAYAKALEAANEVVRLVNSLGLTHAAKGLENRDDRLRELVESSVPQVADARVRFLLDGAPDETRAILERLAETLFNLQLAIMFEGVAGNAVGPQTTATAMNQATELANQIRADVQRQLELLGQPL